MCCNTFKMPHSILLVKYILLCSITLVYTIPMLTLVNNNHTGIKYPIILIPGLGGSQAYCKPKDVGSSFAPFNLWINFFHMLLPNKVFDYFRLQHDPYTYESHDSNECDVTFPGWGDTWSVEYLSQHISFEYFGSLVSELMKDKFYVRNFTMRGAPYDFRKSPDDNKQFVMKFKHLVEETYTNGLDRPVVLLGHSLGSLYTLYFLKNQTKHWKQKYIKSFLSVSAPLGGTVNALMSVTSGYKLFTRYLSAFDPLEAPEHVPEVYCIYGSGLLSVEQVIYKSPSLFISAFPNQSPRIIYGDGDGTVNLRSLKVCTKWPTAKVVEFITSEHRPILSERRFIDFVKQHMNI
ncbi:unnamed protein product [Schistosoma guineensis]|nr:unnamed protein product [Schistosoma guineensis]